MQHDPARIEDTKVWFQKAHEDLQGAEHLFAAHPPLLALSVYHCQQAAEKAFKGFLVWHDTPFRKTHHLEEVGEQCSLIDPSFGALVDRAAELTVYAWKFRYADHPAGPSETEAIAALALAREVYATVLSRLPAEARP